MNNLAHTYLTIYVLGVSVATIIAFLWGLRSAIRRAGLPANHERRSFRAAATLLILWFAAALAASWFGFYQGAETRTPTIQFGLLIPILAGVILYWRSRVLRRVVASASQGFLVGIQIYRVLGLVFLVLLVRGEMPGVFALPAGTGDVAVGLVAPLIAFAAARGLRGSKGLLLAWNWLGLADLLVAVATGFLSSPSPLQALAFGNPNTLITAFPLVMIPVFLVPLAVLLHFASLAKLERTEPSRNLAASVAL